MSVPKVASSKKFVSKSVKKIVTASRDKSTSKIEQVVIQPKVKRNKSKAKEDKSNKQITSRKLETKENIKEKIKKLPIEEVKEIVQVIESVEENYPKIKKGKKQEQKTVKEENKKHKEVKEEKKVKETKAVKTDKGSKDRQEVSKRFKQLSKDKETQQAKEIKPIKDIRPSTEERKTKETKQFKALKSSKEAKPAKEVNSAKEESTTLAKSAGVGMPTKEVKLPKDRSKSKTNIASGKRAKSQKPSKVNEHLQKESTPKNAAPKFELVKVVSEKEDKPKIASKGVEAKREQKYKRKMDKSHTSKRASSEGKISIIKKSKTEIESKLIDSIVEISEKKKKHKSPQNVDKNEKKDKVEKTEKKEKIISRFKNSQQKEKSVKKDKPLKTKDQLLAGKKREHKHDDKNGNKRVKQDQSHKHK